MLEIIFWWFSFSFSIKRDKALEELKNLYINSNWISRSEAPGQKWYAPPSECYPHLFTLPWLWVAANFKTPHSRYRSGMTCAWNVKNVILTPCLVTAKIKNKQVNKFTFNGKETITLRCSFVPCKQMRNCAPACHTDPTMPAFYLNVNAPLIQQERYRQPSI